MRGTADVSDDSVLYFCLGAGVRGAGRHSLQKSGVLRAAAGAVLLQRRGHLDIVGRRVPRHRPGFGLRRRGHGAVLVRRDDARCESGTAAQGIRRLLAVDRGGGGLCGIRDDQCHRGEAPWRGGLEDGACDRSRLFQHPRLRGAVAAVILLVASVAAIVLTLRQRKGGKPQDIAKQVAVRAKDRVRIVKMASEKRP